MNIAISAAFGILFLVLSFAVTFLMFYLWSFPYDKATRTSAAPRSLMRVHRVLGYAYVGVYILMMALMVPRMWQYQVEFASRTVAHLLLGCLIGVLLLLKIAILRFFRYYEEWMPFIGTGLFVCTVLLLALSLPSVAHERALENGAVGGGVYSTANRQRLSAVLPQAGFAPGTALQSLTTPASLRAGRSVLLDQCVRCHDLKTVLARPRSPADWLETVRRMSAKPALFAPITEQSQNRVTAYLIAITPDLAPPTAVLPGPADRRLRDQEPPAEIRRAKGATDGMDRQAARATYERLCSQCHALSAVEKSPPGSIGEVQRLIQRMSKNGMRASPKELQQVQFHLTQTYAPGN